MNKVFDKLTLIVGEKNILTEQANLGLEKRIFLQTIDFLWRSLVFTNRSVAFSNRLVSSPLLVSTSRPASGLDISVHKWTE